jgi:Ca2+-binding RTX toxin-like protein
MVNGFLSRFAIFGLVMLILASLISAVAASNTVPGTRADDVAQTINANALKPTECAAINLTTILVCPGGGGTCRGTNANELILGSPNADTITGRGGTDCILGGGGNDSITGNGATDVCIGGPGTDTFATCETAIQ